MTKSGHLSFVNCSIFTKGQKISDGNCSVLNSSKKLFLISALMDQIEKKRAPIRIRMCLYVFDSTHFAKIRKQIRLFFGGIEDSTIYSIDFLTFRANLT